MTNRQEAVRELFENTARYLKYDYNLRIRRETVEHFTRDLSFNNILDMPCGNGEISKGLVEKAAKVVMMDLSVNMITLAKQNTDLHHKIDFHHSDFFQRDFGNQKFDLVICLGLMAHVDNAEILMKKIASLVNTGGYLVIQNTDSRHFYNYLIRFYLGLRSVFRKQNYRLNNVSGEKVEAFLSAQSLELKRTFRYNQSFLGFSNLFKNETKYKLTVGFFGSAKVPRNQAWGSDVTYLFKKIS